MDRVSQILNDAKTRGPDMWDNSKLTSYVKALQPPLNGAERLQLVAGLINRDTFLWLDYVSEEIENLASVNPSYIDSLADVIDKVKTDLAGGQIIKALIQVGESNPSLGIELSSAMRQRNDEGLILYSSLPLGGAARAGFDRVKPLIDELCSSNNLSYKIAALRALRITFQPGRRDKPVPEETFQD